MRVALDHPARVELRVAAELVGPRDARAGKLRASGPERRLRMLAQYKLAWSRLLGGDAAGALVAADAMPTGASPELLEDLTALREAARQRLGP